MELVAVQLVKSYCLPLLVYCVGALRWLVLLSASFLFVGMTLLEKSFILRDLNLLEFCKQFGSIDFQHLYDLAFLKSIGGKCVHWSKFVRMLNIQFHICDDLFDKDVVKKLVLIVHYSASA